jgi:hypothetical protein
MGWAGHEARIHTMRSAYKMLVRKLEAKSPLEKPRRRWENDIGRDLKEKG